MEIKFWEKKLYICRSFNGISTSVFLCSHSLYPVGLHLYPFVVLPWMSFILISGPLRERLFLLSPDLGHSDASFAVQLWYHFSRNSLLMSRPDLGILLWAPLAILVSLSIALVMLCFNFWLMALSSLPEAEFHQGRNFVYLIYIRIPASKTPGT